MSNITPPFLELCHGPVVILVVWLPAHIGIAEITPNPIHAFGTDMIRRTRLIRAIAAYLPMTPTGWAHVNFERMVILLTCVTAIITLRMMNQIIHKLIEIRFLRKEIAVTTVGMEGVALCVVRVGRIVGKSTVDVAICADALPKLGKGPKTVFVMDTPRHNGLDAVGLLASGAHPDP